MSDEQVNEHVENSEEIPPINEAEEFDGRVVMSEGAHNPPPPQDPPAPRVGRDAIMEATADAVKYFEQQFKAMYPEQEFNQSQAALGIEQAIIAAWPALYNEATRINQMIEEELQSLEELPTVPESHDEQSEED